MTKEIRIFHTNDVHSHLNNYSNITEYIKAAQSKNTIYVDVGDHMDRMHPYTEATLGKGNVELLNEAGCSVATIGNNEGITLTKKELKNLYTKAEFDVVCVNVRDETGLLFKPYTIKNIEGLNVGFIGATVEFTPFYRALGWDVEGAFQRIEHYLNEMAPHCDAIVMLSHLGKYDDERLAERFSEIDVILGGHTHHLFPEGKVINDVLLAATGRFGEYVGEVRLQFENKNLVKKSARVIDSEALVGHESTLYETGKKMLNKEIIARNVPKIDRTLYTMNWFTYRLLEMIEEFTNSDVQLINAGVIASKFDGGTFTLYDLHNVFPHSINMVKVEVTGRMLKEIYVMANEQEYKEEVLRGLGFRGDIFGVFLMRGLSVIEGERKAFVNGKLVNDQETYTVGTFDMYTFGRFFPQFKAAKKEYYMPEFLSDLVEMYKNKLYK